MDLLELYNVVKRNFCELTSYKVRGNVLEIITAFSTLNNKFVSVFIKEESGKIIVTDNGWVDLNTYETPLYEESDDIIKRVQINYANTFAIKSTIDKTGVTFYYKTCINYESLSSTVFDVANFIVGVVNSFCIQYIDTKEEKERETFRKDANAFLSSEYHKGVKFRQSLEGISNIKFSAIITKKSELYLISYITGSTNNYFDNDIRKTIVNFEIALKSKYQHVIKERLSLINNLSDGYNPTKSSSILGLLEEKNSREPIKWSEKEKILEYVHMDFN